MPPSTKSGFDNPVLTTLLQPFAVGPLSNWLRMLYIGGGVSPRYLPKAVYITLSSLATAPLRLLETARYAREVERYRIEQPPLFVLGHWRSGTTHLHNLLCQDPRFGYISTFQTTVPAVFFVGDRFLRPALSRLMPRQRPMDNMELTPDVPAEEEIALAQLSPYSYYHAYYFPRRAPHFFRRYALMDGATPREHEAWKRIYLRLLKKASMAGGGKPLAIKNPVNTGRIATLLELFPDAKFIHIRRNPYTVFASTRRLQRKMYQISALQDYDNTQIDRNIVEFYKGLMGKYLEQRSLIPSGRLAEVGFEELEQDPVGTLSEAYERLELGGFEEVKPRLEAYVEGLSGYRKNVHALEPAILRTIAREWQFSLKEWPYQPPPELTSDGGGSESG